MRIGLVKRFSAFMFTLIVLKEEYSISAIRESSGISNSLSETLKGEKA